VPEARDEPAADEGLIRIHSPSPRLGYLLAGLVGLALPAVLFVSLVAASFLTLARGAGDQAAPATADPPTPWWPVVLALLLFIPLHELAHAVVHPGMGLSSRTIVVLWPAKLRFGVYYEGCMTRRRWLVMRLAPLVCLSVIPVLLTLFMVVPASFATEIFWQVLALVNGIGSGGDIVAAIWVRFQVPAGGEICFRGGKAYWR
jgi:hypothetical protein